MKFIVTKLAEYTPKYNLCRNSSEVVVADINNPDSLLAALDGQSTDIIDGFITTVNPRTIYTGGIIVNNYKYTGPVVTQLGDMLICTFNSSYTTTKVFYGWQKRYLQILMGFIILEYLVLLIMVV